MKIFRLKADLKYVPVLLPVDDSSYDFMDFDGTPKLDEWNPIAFYNSQPKKKVGNFFALSSSPAFVCDSEAADRFSAFLGFGSELLPIYLEDGKELYIVNVTECINALDQKKTEFDYYSDGTRGRILNYAFYSSRLDESSIFKIPETANIEVLAYTGYKSPEDEFYNEYKSSGFNGLVFEEIYSED